MIGVLVAHTASFSTDGVVHFFDAQPTMAQLGRRQQGVNSLAPVRHSRTQRNWRDARKRKAAWMG
jgi:hypothetical protein